MPKLRSLKLSNPPKPLTEVTIKTTVVHRLLHCCSKTDPEYKLFANMRSLWRKKKLSATTIAKLLADNGYVLVEESKFKYDDTTH